MICRAEVLPGVFFVSGSPAEAKDADPLTAAGSLTASVTTKLSAVAPEASLQIWPPQVLWGSWYETVLKKQLLQMGKKSEDI